MLVALAACGADNSTLADLGPVGPPDVSFEPDAEIGSPDAAPPPSRCLAFSPVAYFHEVTLGREAWLRFSVQNTCRSPRRLESARLIDPEDVFGLDPLPLPYVLDRDEVLRISVRFAPLAPKDYEAQVAFEVDDPDQPAFRVRIFGVGVGGELRAFPSRLEHEKASVGCRTSSRTVALWNEGPGPMYVFSVELEGPDADAFDVGYPTVLPTDVPAFEGLPVELSFRPTRAGPHDAALLIRYNGRESPARVPLFAHAEGSRLREEHFELSPQPRHDLLFLVPPSKETRGEADAFVAFVRQLRAENAVDLRLLITPSGARDPVIGRPIACPGFSPLLELGAIDPPLLDVLVPCMLSVGRSEERPRSSAVLVSALEESFVKMSDEEERSLRPDSMVHVVFTTFHDEWKLPLPFVIDFLQSLPPTSPAAVQVHAYDIPTPDQPSPFGARHHAIVRATGGRFIDQGSDAWTRFFGALAEDMTNGPRSLRLGARAEPTSIEVRRTSSSSTITFTLGAEADRIDLPALAGGPIDVRYVARCEP